VGKQRIQGLAEEFEARDFRIAQIDDHAGAFRGLNARLMHRLPQRRGRFALARRRGGFAFSTPHGLYVPE